MRMGVHRDTLAASMQGADRIWLYQSPDLDWSLDHIVQALDVPASIENSIEELVRAVVHEARPGDHVLVMSNGGFGGIHDRLLASLPR
jgi:UDP-N-acetylmuramate: L-alanyl-gamma-D-glutamyl-meso-diaminopimelate ligase